MGETVTAVSAEALRYDFGVAAPEAPAALIIAMAGAEPNVVRVLPGKFVVKRIRVPNRIVNFVVAR
jgi:hypothetical protein